ncbi:uncharacterized protein LOC135119552 [Zophobas morio]|uniref:uncharacterized protein LOC135119552 n=1 Tax=Zophobas morio TaxID=2755281 RepID=UPI0030839234
MEMLISKLVSFGSPIIAMHLRFILLERNPHCETRKSLELLLLFLAKHNSMGAVPALLAKFALCGGTFRYPEASLLLLNCARRGLHAEVEEVWRLMVQADRSSLEAQTSYFEALSYLKDKHTAALIYISLKPLLAVNQNSVITQKVIKTIFFSSMRLGSLDDALALLNSDHLFCTSTGIACFFGAISDCSMWELFVPKLLKLLYLKKMSLVCCEDLISALARCHWRLLTARSVNDTENLTVINFNFAKRFIFTYNQLLCPFEIYLESVVQPAPH